MSDSEIHGDGSNLSIEETNKLRIKLGLQPLTDEVQEDGEAKKDYVHKPAENIAKKQHDEKSYNKIVKHREERELLMKLKAVKPLTDNPIESFNISAMLKTIEEKKRKEEQESSEEDEQPQYNLPGYTGEDLEGMTVEHSTSRFNSYMPTILTLKDSNVLDKESGDVLVNVNFLDYERSEENVKNKKLGVHYLPTESDEDDDYNIGLKPICLLPKYKEKETKRFVLGSSGKYDLTNENRYMEMQSKFMGTKINLPEREPQLASNYFTPEELKARTLKKGKRKAKMTRSNTKIATVKLESNTEDIKPKKEEGELIEEDNGSKSSAKRAKNNAGMSVKKERVELTKATVESDDDDLDFRPTLVFSDIKPVTMFNPRLRNEIATLRKTKPVPMEEDQSYLSSDEETKRGSIGLRISVSAATNEDVFSKLKAQQESDAMQAAQTKEYPTIVQTTISPIKTMNTTKKMDTGEPEEQAQSSGWQPEDKILSAPTQERKRNIKPTPSSPQPKRKMTLMEGVLGDEVQLNKGVFSALLLAQKKGYLEQPREETILSNPKSNTLKAKNFYEEKVRYEDIDAKAPRQRERYTGPLSTFQDKKDFNPEIKLEYHDEFGRPQEPKEAFRTLSHRFHGKASGKIKCEKRFTRYKKEMEQGAVVGDVAMRSVEKQYSKMKEDKKFCVALSGKNAIIPSALRRQTTDKKDKKDKKDKRDRKDKASPK